MNELSHNPAPCPKRNIILVLEYDGSLFHGWQSQINAAAVQDIVTGAVRRLDGEPPERLTGASRTDAGVHAKGQVVNFFTNSRIPADKYAYALNTVLPPGIACVRSAEAAPDFHARFSAKGKIYTYLILNRRQPSPLYRNRAWHIPLPLDAGLMRESARLLVGEHDFKAFMSAGSPVSSTVRTVTRLDLDLFRANALDPYASCAPGPYPSCAFASSPFCAPVPFPSCVPGPFPSCALASSPFCASDPFPSIAGTFIRMTVEGNGFLYNMVRIIAGTLVYVGQGRLYAGEVTRALDSGNRAAAGKTAPAHGLYLERVIYD